MTRTLLLFLTLLCGNLLCASARADAVANVNHNGSVFRSFHGQGSATVRMVDASEVLIESRKKKKKYAIPLDLFHLQNGDFYLSEDGEVVVWKLKDHFLSSNVKPDADALVVYREGKLVKKLLLKDLVKDFQGLPSSVSHTNWQIAEKIDFDLLQLQLTTTEYKVFVIDLRDLKVLKESFLDSYDDAPIIVHGRFAKQSDVDRFSGAPAKFDVFKWIKGNYDEKQISVRGLDPKLPLPTGGPFILRREDGIWHFVGEFYDGVQRIAPQSSMKYGAYFLPRLSAELTPSGKLILRRQEQGNEGLVVVWLIPIKNLGNTPYTTVVTVVPGASWETKKEDPPIQPGRIFTYATINGDWKNVADKRSLLSIDHDVRNGMKTDSLNLTMPSPGPNFTTYEEGHLKLSNNPVNLSSTASVSEIKTFFANLQVKDVEVVDYK